ncbi:hypothetical protein N665_0200s0002 [Sinapis alba]|nr:hypothetical protein N665_0200s0002 [Sinapis alba]
MPEEPNLKLMGMWMLLVRTIRIEEEDIAWYRINGVPIRYSMRENSLISGLDCHEYPKRYLKLESYNFVDAYFSNRDNITIEDVKQKLLGMKPCSDRLKMAVLFFLGRIIKGKLKNSGPLDQFILRIVDRLDVCRTFPWGRLTFEDAIKGITHMMDLLKGEPNSSTGFAEFIILLEVIDSMLLPTVDEEIMLARIIDVEEEYEREGGQIFKKENKDKEKEVEASCNADLDSTLKALEERIVKSMGEGFTELKAQVETKLESMDGRLSGMEKTQKLLKRKARKMDRRLTSLEAKGNVDMNQGECMDFEQWGSMLLGMIHAHQSCDEPNRSEYWELVCQNYRDNIEPT